MDLDDSQIIRRGIERSCAPVVADRFRFAERGGDFSVLEAHLRDLSYRPHRHDTYAIGLTMAGVQRYAYRGAGRVSMPGEVVALHPDETHDGEAGTPEGLSYRMVYLAPASIRAALGDRARHLPFVAGGHSRDPRLVRAVGAALADPARSPEPLEKDETVLALAEALLALDPGARAHPGRADLGISALAVRRAKEALDAACPDALSADALERLTGLGRFELARQFRRAHGVGPHRYLVLRRLDLARRLMTRADFGLARVSLTRVAAEAGFADQAHFIRCFRGAHGVTPGEWRRLARA